MIFNANDAVMRIFCVLHVMSMNITMTNRIIGYGETDFNDAFPCYIPNDDSDMYVLQASHLRKLEGEKQEAAQKLEESVKRGEKLLEQIQEALQDIAQAQLKLQCISDSSNPNIEQNPLDSTLSSSGHHSTTGHHHPSGTSS